MAINGTTYDLPNYTGELFAASPEDTPLLSAIGGLTGGKAVQSTLIQWQTYELREGGDRRRVEGAVAPEANTRPRASVTNVLEIHQEVVELSYSRQAAVNQISTSSDAPFVAIGDARVPADELSWQINAQLKQIARDVDWAFVAGKYNLPATNADARRTRGIIDAIKTNKVTTAHKAAELTADDVQDALQKVWENGGVQESETRTIIVGPALKRAVTRAFVSPTRPALVERNVGGVNLTTIDTDFGSCNVMLDRFVPAETLVIVSLEQLVPCFLEVPGKGVFFAEPLARTGATDRIQVYGEIGLEYGSEKAHGLLTVAKTA